MPWLLLEDQALKTKLTGLTVSDVNDPARPVAVKYRDPEIELSDMTFPTIVIEHAGISKAEDREHRGVGYLNYAPEGVEPWWDVDHPEWQFDPAKQEYLTEIPIPINLDYQVTVYARKQLHAMAITGALAAPDRLPFRFGYLEVPQDGTIRTLDVIGGPEIETSKDTNNKRIIRTLYSLRVTSEILADLETFVRVQTVEIDLTYDYLLQTQLANDSA
jgi:hypothetical protein